MRHLVYIIASLLLVGIASCNTSGCLENRSSIPLAGFYSADDESIMLDSVRITGLGRSDSAILSAEGTRISSIYLPMRSTMQSTGWVFDYKWKYLPEGFADTIIFDYTSMPYFASSECGVIYRYHIDKMHYTTHLIDSVVVTDSMITNLDIERIKIYFRTE